jgi:hypothetical protein
MKDFGQREFEKCGSKFYHFPVPIILSFVQFFFVLLHKFQKYIFNFFKIYCVSLKPHAPGSHNKTFKAVINSVTWWSRVTLINFHRNLIIYCNVRSKEVLLQGKAHYNLPPCQD